MSVISKYTNIHATAQSVALYRLYVIARHQCRHFGLIPAKQTCSFYFLETKPDQKYVKMAVAS